MKFTFVLAFAKRSSDPLKAFKMSAYRSLFTEYLSRCKPYSTGIQVLSLEAFEKLGTKPATWLCHTSKEAKALSSEQLSEKLNALKTHSASHLAILIGPADGWSAQDLQRIKPDMLWSFGPLTYPHELACVISAEQLYRACSILSNHPYHKGH